MKMKYTLVLSICLVLFVSIFFFQSKISKKTELTSLNSNNSNYISLLNQEKINPSEIEKSINNYKDLSKNDLLKLNKEFNAQLRAEVLQEMVLSDSLSEEEKSQYTQLVINSAAVAKLISENKN